MGTSELIFRAPLLKEFALTSLFILAAAIVAFMLGVSEYLLVYHTSSLTLSIAGVFKVCPTIASFPGSYPRVSLVLITKIMHR